LVIAYLLANPEVSAGVATLVGSLFVALSKLGGEKFALIRRLLRVLGGTSK